MRKLSKKMMISLMTFALVFIALGATTFAWFTLADNASVSNIQVNVSSGGGFEMALEGRNGDKGAYKGNLTADEIAAAVGDLKLLDVTSADGEKFYIFNSKGEKEEISFSSTGTNRFIQFKLHFKASLDGTESKPDNIGVYLVTKANPDYDNVISTKGSFLVSEGITKKISNSFKDYLGNVITPESDAQTYYAADAMMVAFDDVNESNATKIIDFNNSENRNYNDGFAVNAGEQGANLSGAASWYYNHNNGQNLGVGDERSNVVTELSEIDSSNSKPNNENSKICVLTKNTENVYEGSVTVRIWIEGFDYDCFDVIFKDKILAQFEFKIGYNANNE